MNTLKGLGICAVLAGIAFAVTRVATIDQILLVVTITIVSVSLVTYAASVKRRSLDRRAANGRARSRRVASS
jgi:hypothetical protein